MGSQEITIMFDDLDGKQIDEAVTTWFVWENTVYEIDLSPEHYAQFERAMEKYVRNGRVLAKNVSAHAIANAKSVGARSSRVPAEDVLEIRRLFNEGVTNSELAEKFDLGYNTIHGITSGNTYKHLLPVPKGRKQKES